MPERKKMSEKTDKRYRAKVTVPGIDKPVYISAKTRRELEQKKKDVLDEYVHGVKVQDKPFVDMIIEWFTVVKKPKIKRNSTLNSWRSTINCHVLPCFSDRKLTSAVTRQDLQACLDKLAGFSASIITAAYSALKQTCQYAIAEGIILRDPSILLSKPSTPAAKVEGLSDAGSGARAPERSGSLGIRPADLSALLHRLPEGRSAWFDVEGCQLGEEDNPHLSGAGCDAAKGFA